MSDRESRSIFFAWIGSLFLGLLGAIAGGALAIIALVLKPVEVVKQLPNEPDRPKGQVYYVAGERDSVRGKMWSLKRRNLMQGRAGVVTFTEEELNAWLGSTLRTSTPRNPKDPQPNVVAEGLNFRVVEDRLQVGLPIKFNYVEPPIPVVAQAVGEVVPSDSRWYFKPQEVWIGSLPAHRIPGVIDAIVAKELDESWVPPAGLEAWQRVAEVSIQDRLISVRVE